MMMLTWIARPVSGQTDENAPSAAATTPIATIAAWSRRLACGRSGAVANSASARKISQAELRTTSSRCPTVVNRTPLLQKSAASQPAQRTVQADARIIER